MSISVLIWGHLKDSGLEEGTQTRQREAFPPDTHKGHGAKRERETHTGYKLEKGAYCRPPD